MRTRQRGSSWNAVYTRTDISPNGGVDSAATVLSTMVAKSDVESMVDNSTPSFRKLQGLGHAVLNPMTQTRKLTRSDRVQWIFGPVPVWGFRVYEGEMGAVISEAAGPPPDVSGQVDRAIDRCLLNAYSKVAASEATGLVTLAEGKKTIAMLAKPFGNAMTLLKKVNYRFQVLRRLGVNVHNAARTAWLEYRLGWKPLLFDIRNLMDAYNSRLDEDAYFGVRKVARSGTEVAAERPVFWDGSFESLVNVRLRGNITVKVRVSAGVIYRLKDDSAFEYENRRYGMRLSDVPSTLWELVPASFVIDRFLEVGTWLNAIVPKPGVTELGNWVSVKTTTKTNTRVVNAEQLVALPPEYNQYRLRSAGGHYEDELFKSERHIDYPKPILPAMNPNSLSFVQELDHYALASAKIEELVKGLTKYRS